MSVRRSAAWRAFWSNAVVVVIDTETTGLYDDSRILSFASYTLSKGATRSSWSTLIYPGKVDATHIHKLTRDQLVDAQPFSAYADTIRAILTHPNQTVYLCGHNVTYDAERLTYEYSLLGQELPPVTLLDTQALAPAAGYGSAANSLNALASLFGIANPSEHEANADALITREVALRSIDILLASGVSDLSDLATPAPPSLVSDEDDEDPLTDAHSELHAMVLGTKAQKDKSLGGCLALSCPTLNRRIEDGVTSTRAASALFDWTTAQLHDTDLTRYQRGLLINGATRVLTAWREATKTHKQSLWFDKAAQLLATGTDWHACGSTDQCDRCQVEDAEPRDCRFVRAPNALVWNILYNASGTITTPAATAYLFDAKGRPCVGSSWYAKLHLIHPDAALRGASAAAFALRQHKAGTRAQDAMAHLWSQGIREPGITEAYAAIAEDAKLDGDRLTAFLDAALICEEGLLHGTTGPEWTRVIAKYTRLVRRIHAQSAPEYANPYNTRPAHRPRFVKP